MAFNINNFRSAMKGGGARPTLFEVQIDMPFADTSSSAKLTFTCKAAQIPEENLDEITLPYFGRTVKVAGDRTFGDWTVTIMNDEDFLVRDAMERWHQSINSHVANLNESGGPLAYKARDARVIQYGKEGQVLREYKMENCFPKNVAPIDLSWETTNTIEEFQVTFAFDLWTLSATGSRSSAQLNRTLT